MEIELRNEDGSLLVTFDGRFNNYARLIYSTEIAPPFVTWGVRVFTYYSERVGKLIYQEVESMPLDGESKP